MSEKLESKSLERKGGQEHGSILLFKGETDRRLPAGI